MTQQKYDTDLQMFVEEPRPINLNHLAYLRYLGETGRLEEDGGLAGPVGGSLVGRAIAKVEAEAAT